MTNIFIKEFYDDVKDATWPNIDDYEDIINLPPSIKQELDELHNFKNRKNEITSTEYWIDTAYDGCFTNNQDCFFLIIPKCGYQFWYKNLVDNNGWNKASLSQITPNSTVIATCIDPLVRHKKGIAEFFYQYFYKNNFSLNEIDRILDAVLHSLLIPDVHSLPYNIILRNYLNRAIWIPFDKLNVKTTNDIVTSILQKEKHYKFKKKLTNFKIHESSPEKLYIYQKINDNFNKKSEGIYQIYNLLADDLKFYYNLLDNFSVNDYI